MGVDANGRVTRNLAILGAITAALALSACTHSIGAARAPEARLDYNEAVIRSSSEQLLLNLVRLRYRDPIGFLQVNSVATQYPARTAAGSANFDDGLGFTGGGIGVSIPHTESATLTYAPLQGQDYARQLLTPISAETLFLLSESGWSVERLMLCCLDRLGAFTNARSALGPTPDVIPSNADFAELARRMRALQQLDLLDVEIVHGEEGGAVYLRLARNEDVTAAQRDQLAALRRALRIAPEAHRIPLVESGAELDDALAARGRSLLGILYALSHAVEAPAEHVAAGYVTDSRPARDGAADWGSVLGDLFVVRSAEQRPDAAFVAVEYRGYWFYISDRDLDAKSSFSLLGHLLALQSDAAEGGGNSILLIGN